MGRGSIICFPVNAIFNEHYIHIGDDTMIGPDVTLSAGMVPRPGIAPEELWREAATVYAALTRAREELVITYTGAPSPFLNLLLADVDWHASAAVVEQLTSLAR